MRKRKIILVCGARPNFIKIAPIFRELKKYRHLKPMIVHTGQHYNKNMSDLFFCDLELVRPHECLNVGSASHALQTARIMIKLEKYFVTQRPDLVLVVGDVNSTMAASVVAAKLSIPLAHMEAGLRSFDRTMPEEINRIVTDALSDMLFTTCRDAEENLAKEGVPSKKIYFVGNVMIDSLIKLRKKAEKSTILRDLNLQPKRYAVLTLHRPSNVDRKEVFLRIWDAIETVSRKIKIIFPVHPRTKKQLKKFGIKIWGCNIVLLQPLGYLNFLKLYGHAKFVLTDSGGIQEETTFLNIPCVTLRENTERPITITSGTNVLVGRDGKLIVKACNKIIDRTKKNVRKVPQLWDGKTSKRIAKIITESLH